MEDARGSLVDGLKLITIIVNGREKQVAAKELGFDQILGLAFDPVPSGPCWYFTVTYRRGAEPSREGSMLQGDVVRIKPGMVFNVTATDKS